MISEKDIYREIISFIPKHLVEIFHGKNYDYEFKPNYLNYTMLFVDICGFTALSEKLSAIGKEGAEILASIISFYFRKMLEIIEENKGYVIKFGGDALLIMFPVIKGDVGSSVKASLISAREIANFFREAPVAKTPAGKVALSITMAVNNGSVFSSLLGSEDTRLEYFIGGSALNELAKAEESCSAGVITVCESIKKHLTENGIKHRKIREKGVTFYAVKPEDIQRGESPLKAKVKRIKLSYKNLRLQRFVEKFLHPAVLEWIKKGYSFRLSMNEHKRNTIIFVNLLDTEKLKSKEKRGALLNRYFNKLIELCAEYGGSFIGSDISTEGAKFLIIFGAPTALEKEELSAVNFALELRDYLTDFRAKSGTAVKQKIGINTGNVFCGVVGSRLRRDYTSTGDAVNTAARLMSAAGEDMIFAGEETLKRLAGSLNCRKHRIKVKGKKGILSVYEILGKKKEKITNDFEKNFVGRKKEIKLIKKIIKDVAFGKSRGLSITGEAGIGKTYLLRKIISLLPDERISVVRADCLPYGRSTPFSPWINVVKNIFNVTDETTAADFRKLISKHCDETSCALISETVGFAPGNKSEESLIGEKRKIKLTGAFIKVISGFIKEGVPLVLVLEDIHWADELSEELLRKFIGQFPKKNLFLILTGRRLMNSLKNANLRNISLELFSREETEAFLKESFPAEGQKPEFLVEIFRKTGGNPLFLSEIADSLRLNNFSMAELKIPDKVEQLIESRIDNLPLDVKNILKTASVIGNTFNARLLKELLRSFKFEEEQIMAALKKIEKDNLSGYLLKTGPSVYSFKHALIQETVYGSLTYKLKRHLHKFIACWYEDNYGKKYCEVIALHFEKANITKPAFRYLVLAAGRSKDIFANRAALDFYNRAESLYFKNFTRFDRKKKRSVSLLYENKGAIYRTLGRYHTAIKSFEKMNGWTEDRLRSAYSRNLIGSCWRLLGFHRKALNYCLKCLKIGKQLNDTKLVASALTSITVIYWYIGDYEKAIETGDEALNLRRKHKDLSAVSRGLFGLGNSYVKTGDITSAYKCFSELYSLSKKFRDRRGLAYAYEGMGYCRHWRGEIGKALACFEKSLSLRNRMEFYRGMAYCYCDIGSVYFDTGFFGLAENYFNKADKILKETEDNNLKSDVLRNLGSIALINNKKKAALKRLSEAYVLAGKTKFYESQIKSFYSLCVYYIGVGNLKKAGFFCKKLLTVSEKNCLREYLCRGLIIKARILKHKKRHEQAGKICKQAVTLAKGLKNVLLEMEIVKNFISITGKKPEKLVKLLHIAAEKISDSIPDRELAGKFLKNFKVSEKGGNSNG